MHFSPASLRQSATCTNEQRACVASLSNSAVGLSTRSDAQAKLALASHSDSPGKQCGIRCGHVNLGWLMADGGHAPQWGLHTRPDHVCSAAAITSLRSNVAGGADGSLRLT